MARKHGKRHVRELCKLLPDGWKVTGRTARDHLILEGPAGERIIASGTPGPYDGWRATLAKINRATGARA
jgi:hypothetical protein